MRPKIHALSTTDGAGTEIAGGITVPRTVDSTAPSHDHDPLSSSHDRLPSAAASPFADTNVRRGMSGTGLERAIATHGGISDGAIGDGDKSKSDGHRAELQSDLGDAAGDDGPTAVHGCQMGALSATLPNDIEGRSAAAAGTILDATVPAAFGAMVHLLGHHRAPRGRASAQQTTHGRQSDKPGARPYSGYNMSIQATVPRFRRVRLHEGSGVVYARDSGLARNPAH